MIALLIAAAGIAPFQPTGTVARAEVRIRIISGASLTLGQQSREPGAQLRATKLRIDGEPKPARLIEFQ